MNGKSAVASDVRVSGCSTSRASGPATVSPTIESAITSKRIGLPARQVVDEPARVVDLGRLRTEQEEVVVTDPRDRELADDAALRVEHRRQVRAADLREPVGEQPLQPVGGALARHAVLGEVGALAEPDPLAHGPRLLAHALERVRAVERDVLDRLETGALEPQRVLEPEPGTPHRVVLGEAGVDRRRVQRASRRQLLVGERDAEPPRVVLADLGIGVRERRPVAVAGDVHRPDVVVRVAVDHPVGERQADTAALREPGHHRARDPHAAHAADRARRAGCRRG